MIRLAGRLGLAMVGVAGLAGCASVVSDCINGCEKPGKSPVVQGLTYYLPQRDFLVKVTRSGGKYTDISVDVSDAYADRSKTFVLRYQPNLIGENQLIVGIDRAGLLTGESSSTTTPKLAAALDEIAKDAAELVQTLTAQVADKPCNEDKVYVFAVKPANGKSKFCNKEVSVTVVEQCGAKVGGAAANCDDTAEGDAMPEGGWSATGFYYRQDKPYLVSATATEPGEVVADAKLLGSPTGAPVRFLPIERTLFAVNEAKLTFDQGVPTKVDQKTDGEATALLVLPAKILKAYFAAVGAVFAGRKSRDDAELNALKSQAALAAAQLKLQACQLALANAKGKPLTGDECSFK